MATYEIEAPFEIETPHAVTAAVSPGPFVLGEFLENWSASVTHQIVYPFVFAPLAEQFQAVVSESWTRIARAVMSHEFIATIRAHVQTKTATNIVGTMTCGLAARLGTAANGYVLGDVARAIYAQWGNDGIIDLRTITIGRERIVEWCNAAMQLIYSQAARLEYFNRERLDVTVPSSGSVALPAAVQKIMGAAHIAGRYLKPLESKEQVDTFASIYGGTVPLAFLVESIRDSAADSLALTLYLAPAPSEDTLVTLDVTNEPPRWNSADLLSGAVIPLPHKWVETLFMPLVRKWAAGDGRMPKSARAAQIQEIDAQYAAARQMLGLADIDPVNIKDSKEVTKEV